MIPKLALSSDCTGCGACKNKCPKKAITMEYNEEGFLVPVVNSDQCIGCGLCEKVCPILSSPDLERKSEPEAYACWNNDDQIRFDSSSGGMFSVYANYILSHRGVVYGVDYSKDLIPQFIEVDDISQLNRLYTSKYVQAEVGDIYRKVQKQLKQNRLVLFVGTPCQVAGLYSFLGQKYDNLYTCDLICFGVPSPLLFKKWLDYLEKRLGNKITSVNMRKKTEKGWSLLYRIVEIETDSGQVYQFESSDPMGSYPGILFGSCLTLRESCFSCRFAKIPRIGDITLGDFWGIGRVQEFPYDVKKGVSLNLVNSNKGQFLVDQCSREAFYCKRDINEALQGNPRLISLNPTPILRKSFLADAMSLSYEDLLKKYHKVLYGTFLKRVSRKFLHFLMRTFEIVFGKTMAQKARGILKKCIRECSHKAP